MIFRSVNFYKNHKVTRSTQHIWKDTLLLWEKSSKFRTKCTERYIASMKHSNSIFSLQLLWAYQYWINNAVCHWRGSWWASCAHTRPSYLVWPWWFWNIRRTEMQHLSLERWSCAHWHRIEVYNFSPGKHISETINICQHNHKNLVFRMFQKWTMNSWLICCMHRCMILLISQQCQPKNECLSLAVFRW